MSVLCLSLALHFLSEEPGDREAWVGSATMQHRTEQGRARGGSTPSRLRWGVLGDFPTRSGV